MKRIKLFTFIIAASLVFTTTACSQEKANVSDDINYELLTKETRDNMTPEEVLQAFKDGNKRFVDGDLQLRRLQLEIEGTAEGQNPYAIVFSCVDSRVPVETIFDKRMGMIFSTRIAGNVVNEDVVGGMEFATNFAGAKLILVMGHTKCGAVQGAIGDVEYGNLTGLVNKIKPAEEKVRAEITTVFDESSYEFTDRVAQEQVVETIAQIREMSPDLVQLEKDGRIMIVGAMYEIETGKVKFL